MKLACDVLVCDGLHRSPEVTSTDHETGRLASFVRFRQRSTVPNSQPVLISGSQASGKVQCQSIQRLCSRLSLNGERASADQTVWLSSGMRGEQRNSPHQDPVRIDPLSRLNPSCPDFGNEGSVDTTVNGNETSKICSRTYPHMSATSRLVDQINHSFTIVHAGIQ